MAGAQELLGEVEVLVAQKGMADFVADDRADAFGGCGAGVADVVGVACADPQAGQDAGADVEREQVNRPVPAGGERWSYATAGGLVARTASASRKTPG